MNLRAFLSPDYLLSTANSATYDSYYLAVALFIFIFPIVLRVFFKFRKRLDVYRGFDRLWLWGYIVLGVVGLFIWLSRSQGLPTFSIRLFSYLWLLSILAYAGYLFYYYRTKVVKSLPKHFEKKRKERYLKG